jgi:hypothetical protein
MIWLVDSKNKLEQMFYMNRVLTEANTFHG